jgi:hypothetical protein
MSNVMCFVQASAFIRDGMAVLDKNDKQAVYLNAVNAVMGSVPERGRVVSGTIAESLGIKPGEFYCVMLKPGEYNGAITYSPVSAKKLSMVEIMELTTAINTQNVVSELQKSAPKTYTEFVVPTEEYDEEF